MRFSISHLLLAIFLLFPVGCISQKPVISAEIDNYWHLSSLPVQADSAAAPKRLAGKLPSHWIIRQNPSLIRSTVSIVRATDHLNAGADSIKFIIAPEYARSVQKTLSDVRQTLENLSELAVSEKSVDRKKWAQTLAKTLVTLESSLRYATLEEPSAGAAPNDPTALAAQPLLEMISLYLNERAGESLLADLKTEELHQLRTVLFHLTLRIGFELAGRSIPDPLRSQILTQMQQAADPQKQKLELENLLVRSIEQAPLASAGNQLRSYLQTALRWSPKMLFILESFLGQWDRVDYIECSIDTIDKKSLITADIHILPRREIRMAQVMPFQPNLVFRGHSRIIFPPEDSLMREFSILFEPVGDGGVELRFENPVYALVRWLVLPLDDAKLREARVLSSSADASTHLTSVTLLLESLRDKKDPRRLILFQDVRSNTAIRDLFSVETQPLYSQTQFHYIRPDKRFSFQRKTSSHSIR
jgi:hypothetical protein